MKLALVEPTSTDTPELEAELKTLITKVFLQNREKAFAEAVKLAKRSTLDPAMMKTDDFAYFLIDVVRTSFTAGALAAYAQNEVVDRCVNAVEQMAA